MRPAEMWKGVPVCARHLCLLGREFAASLAMEAVVTPEDKQYLLESGVLPALRARDEKRAIRHAELAVIRKGLTRLLESRSWPLKDEMFLATMIELSGGNPSARAPRHEEVERIRVFLESVVAQPPVAKSEPPLTENEGLERILGAASTLLDVSFLRRGLEVSSSVVLVVARHGSGPPQYGTGFRVGARLVLTNHHVVHTDAGTVCNISLIPGYETPWEGEYKHHSEFMSISGTVSVRCSERVSGSAARDWALLECSELLPTGVGSVSLSNLGAPTQDQPAFIVQHASARPKKIGLYRNLIRHVDADILRYHTDTEPGSSGSPVFDSSWRLIGLHYRTIAAPEELVSGYLNQGMRIEPIVDRLTALSISVE